MRRRPGSRLTKYFGAMLTNAPEGCLCHDRAHLMDVMGLEWCEDNIRYLVGWLEDEADERGLFDDPHLQQRMEKYLRRTSRTFRLLLRWAPAAAKNHVRESNWARKLVIRRLLMTFIRRSYRHA